MYNSSSLGSSTHRHPLLVDNSRKMVEYKRFGQDFFSGADTKIYFGDILVDTVMNLQFSMMENVVPIYGYKSYTFDAVARGNRIIKGSFRIAFKEAYYLHSIINEIEYRIDAGTLKSKAFTFNSSYTENTIERIMASSDNPDRFEELADEYEKAMWGEGNEAFTSRAKEQNTTTYFYPEAKQDYINNWGFTIMITYGNIDRETIIQGNQATQPHSTTETIIGVQLMEVGKVIDISGQPLFEEYTFIAKDINRAIAK